MTSTSKDAWVVTSEQSESLQCCRKASWCLDQDDQTCCTAQYYMLRYYLYKNSQAEEVNIPDVVLIAVCIFLAGKTCEEDRSIRDTINVTYRQYYPQRERLRVDSTYEALKGNVLKAEKAILRILNFRVTYNYPHKDAVVLLHHLVQDDLIGRKGGDDAETMPCTQTRLGTLGNTLSALLNDIHMLSCLPVVEDPCVVACAALQLAFRIASCGVVFMGDGEKGSSGSDVPFSSFFTSYLGEERAKRVPLVLDDILFAFSASIENEGNAAKL
eukprot:m.3273 g.3273  ORF g.3273 m.3273 type:complete len:271 (+) comp2042_c0_seq1:29-841(+)